MRTTLITLILAMASAVVAAQTTEGAREPADGGSLLDGLADFLGYAPVEKVREREAAVEKHDARLRKREAAVERHDWRLRKREAAVEKHDARLRTREAAVEKHDARLRTHEAAVERHAAGLRTREAAVGRREAAVIVKGFGIAGVGVILGCSLGAWSLWRLQPSRLRRLNQRRRNAEQSLASMQDERDQAQTRLRETEAARLRNAQNVLRMTIQKLQETEQKLQETEAKRREAESTIIRLKAELEDAKRKAREADGSQSTQERTARQILGVAVGASKVDVKAAYRRVASTVHPDRYERREADWREANRLMQLANDALVQLGAA